MHFRGVKLAHTIVQAGLAVLFVVSGVLLWLGERDTTLRLPGTLALHDAATLLLAVLVGGHVYMALSRPGATEGILRGTVPAQYAAEHHPKWQPPARPAAPGRPGAGAVVLAVLVALAGLGATLLLVADVAA